MIAPTITKMTALAMPQHFHDVVQQQHLFLE
jgi:hypothetical protein